jgi:hypothetical protein
LEQLPFKWKNVKDKHLLKAQTIKRFTLFFSYLPRGCSSGIRDIIAGVKLMSSDSRPPEEISETLKAAEKRFLSEIKQRKKLRDYLVGCEKVISPGKRYKEYFNIFAENRARRRREDPELNTYLDEILKNNGRK